MDFSRFLTATLPYNTQQAKHKDLRYLDNSESDFWLCKEGHFIPKTLSFSDYKSNVIIWTVWKTEKKIKHTHTQKNQIIGNFTISREHHSACFDVFPSSLFSVCFKNVRIHSFKNEPWVSRDSSCESAVKPLSSCCRLSPPLNNLFVSDTPTHCVNASCLISACWTSTLGVS